MAKEGIGTDEEKHLELCWMMAGRLLLTAPQGTRGNGRKYVETPRYRLGVWK